MDYQDLLSKREKTEPRPDIRTAKGFEQVYCSFFKRMLLICYSKVADEDLAKDIIQDIFKSLWDRRKTLVINGDIEHYLMRALKFKMIDYFRQVSRREALKNIAIQPIAESHNHTEEHIAYTELKNQVHKATDKLPDQCRKVFRMSREQGLSNKEIARSLVISERAVAYHISYALQFLRKKGVAEASRL